MVGSGSFVTPYTFLEQGKGNDKEGIVRGKGLAVKSYYHPEGRVRTIVINFPSVFI